MSDLKKNFERYSMEFTKQQSNLNELMTARSQLETQLQENKIVLDEFENLKEDSKIYKLTGPVLFPQEYGEAKSNVKKRIEFIQGEIERVEKKVDEAQKSIETTRDKLLEVRTQMAQ